MGAEQAAAIAEEISRDRREDEKRPPEAVGTAIESGNANGSAIGIGGSHIGLNGVDEQFSIRIIRTAVDHGINFKENLNAIHYCR